MTYEFYPTPAVFTQWLIAELQAIRGPITGRCLEPCSGAGAIPHAVPELRSSNTYRRWITNDLNPHWVADYHLDATKDELYSVVNAAGGIDWSISNTPFTSALEIIEQNLKHARVGVAMHLRASIHEVLKTGPRRTWMDEHTPMGILWLPRYAYQRSKSTDKWATDTVCACWVVWLKDPAVPSFIRYAPTWVLDQLEQDTREYRRTLDLLMERYHE